MAAHDTEDRFWWYRYGEHKEASFIALMQRHHIPTRRNPAKLLEPHAPDLLVCGRLSDLKTQNTPFFTAARYDMNPRYTVTFNRKDYERYVIDLPDIWLYFWIHWTDTTWHLRVVEPINAVYEIQFPLLRARIAAAPEHYYQRRQTDPRHNAASSFLLDVRDMELVLEL